MNVEFHTTPILQNIFQRGPALKATLRMLEGLVNGSLHVMPDFAPDAPGLLPVGLEFSTNGILLPHAIPDVGCGYRLLRSPLHLSDLSPRVLQKILSVVNRFRDWPPLSEVDPDNVFARGIQAVHEAGFICVPAGFSIGEADPETIPHQARHLAIEELPRHGGWGHFIELLGVASCASLTSPVREGDVLLLIHTGSERVGDLTFFEYFRKCKLDRRRRPFLDPDSKQGRDYLRATHALIHYAQARREVLSVLLPAEIGRAFGVQESWEFLSDVPHVILQAGTPGTEGFLHARGVQHLKNDIPGIICGDVSIPSYVVRARCSRPASICHGRAVCRLPRRLSTEDRELLERSRHVVCNRDDARQKARLAPWRYQAMRGIKEALASMDSKVEVLGALVPLLNYRGHPKPHRLGKHP